MAEAATGSPFARVWSCAEFGTVIVLVVAATLVFPLVLVVGHVIGWLRVWQLFAVPSIGDRGAIRQYAGKGQFTQERTNESRSVGLLPMPPASGKECRQRVARSPGLSIRGGV